MGFECAIAVVIPMTNNSVKDCYPPVEKEESGFFDLRNKIYLPARVWEVFKFYDFGGVRMLEKSTSSLSPSQRAGSGSIARAAICTASHVHNHFVQVEAKAYKGDTEYLVPFIADPMQLARDEPGMDQFNYDNLFCDVFERLGTRDVVVGLWSPDRNFIPMSAKDSWKIYAGSSYWRYNQGLIRGEPYSGIMAKERLFTCGLLWDSAHTIALQLDDLLSGASVESVELARDPISHTVVSSWREQLKVLSKLGARVIILTGAYHYDAGGAIRSRSRYL